MSDGSIRFLSEDQAKLLRMINGQRDAVQHYLLDISEELLYLHIQAGVALFREILMCVFGIDLASKLPNRVLPVSTLPPTDLHTLFDREIDVVRLMLAPGNRKRVDAESRLRSLIIVDKALIGGDVQQPDRRDSNRRGKRLVDGVDWREVFIGVASVQVDTEGIGHAITFVMSKKQDAIPVSMETTTNGASHESAIIQRVNDFDKFSLGRDMLAEHLNLNSYQTDAMIWFLRLKENPEAYKAFRRKSQVIQGYSQQALVLIRKHLEEETIESVCEKYKAYLKSKRKQKAAPQR